jgi:hypothetical protein
VAGNANTKARPNTHVVYADTQILGMQIEVDTTPLRRDKTAEKGPDGG